MRRKDIPNDVAASWLTNMSADTDATEKNASIAATVGGVLGGGIGTYKSVQRHKKMPSGLTNYQEHIAARNKKKQEERARTGEKPGFVDRMKDQVERGEGGWADFGQKNPLAAIATEGIVAAVAGAAAGKGVEAAYRNSVLRDFAALKTAAELPTNLRGSMFDIMAKNYVKRTTPLGRRVGQVRAMGPNLQDLDNQSDWVDDPSRDERRAALNDLFGGPKEVSMSKSAAIFGATPSHRIGTPLPIDVSDRVSALRSYYTSKAKEEPTSYGTAAGIGGLIGGSLGVLGGGLAGGAPGALLGLGLGGLTGAGVGVLSSAIDREKIERASLMQAASDEELKMDAYRRMDAERNREIRQQRKREEEQRQELRSIKRDLGMIRNNQEMDRIRTRFGSPRSYSSPGYPYRSMGMGKISEASGQWRVQGPYEAMFKKASEHEEIKPDAVEVTSQVPKSLKDKLTTAFKEMKLPRINDVDHAGQKVNPHKQPKEKGYASAHQVAVNEPVGDGS